MQCCRQVRQQTQGSPGYLAQWLDYAFWNQSYHGWNSHFASWGSCDPRGVGWVGILTGVLLNFIHCFHNRRRSILKPRCPYNTGLTVDFCLGPWVYEQILQALQRAETWDRAYLVMLGFASYPGCGVTLEGKFNNYVFTDWANTACALGGLRIYTFRA